MNYLAHWDGTAWQAFGSGVNSGVYAMTEYAGQLAIGGDFTLAGGASSVRLATWNGASWQNLGSGANARVQTLSTYGGQLISGGNFTTMSSIATNYLAKWNGTTGNHSGQACFMPETNPMLPL